MGQKVNPHGLRVGVIKDWDSRWFANDRREFGEFLKEDHVLRTSLKKELYSAGLAKIEIERSANKIKMDLHVAKPGVVIGKGGAGIEALKKRLETMTGKTVILNIIEVRNIDRDAQLVAENIAQAIERRIAFRRAMKQSVQRTMKSGAKGIKVSASGRLGGAEMARTEGYAEGVVPLHTLRADIDYGFAEADTTYGKLGVKVWICKGEILKSRNGEKRDLDSLMGRDDKKKKKRFNNNNGDFNPNKKRFNNDKRSGNRQHTRKSEAQN